MALVLLLRQNLLVKLCKMGLKSIFSLLDSLMVLQCRGVQGLIWSELNICLFNCALNLWLLLLYILFCLGLSTSNLRSLSSSSNVGVVLEALLEMNEAHVVVP